MHQLLLQEQCFWPPCYTPQQMVDPAVFPLYCGLLLSLFQFSLCRLVTYSAQSFCALLLMLLYFPVALSYVCLAWNDLSAIGLTIPFGLGKGCRRLRGLCNYGVGNKVH